MYDKTVRRRRAVLVVLVALSLILLTAYFGESPNGRLHGVQRGFLTVVSPIQEGANAALKPVRNLFGWFGSAVHAKDQLAEVRKQNNRLRAELIEREDDNRGYHKLLQLYKLDGGLHISDYRPVAATVQGQSPNIWYTTVNIDKGTSAGVQVNDPVIDGEGLVGKVTFAASDGAQVSLITDSSVAVSAMISSTGAPGLVLPKVGAPNTLVMQYLPANTPVSVGEYVVTSGTISSHGDSLFPRGIAIGQVTEVGEEAPYKTVEVSPLANLHGLEAVQVLTATRGSAPAQASSVAAALSPGQSSERSGAAGEGQLASTGSGG
ncbi:MAG: rod shape-determining protein MreC [Solirubrobacteraceae bacterium]